LIQETVLSNDKLIASIEDQELGQKILDFEKNVNAKIKESYKEIEQNTNKIAKDSAKSITDLNLPTKIDKLDANIAGISVSTQNLQGRIDLLEGNLNDKFKDSNEKLNSEFIKLGKAINDKTDQVVNAVNTLEKKIIKFENSLNNKFTITWVLVVIVFLATLIF